MDKEKEISVITLEVEIDNNFCLLVIVHQK